MLSNTNVGGENCHRGSALGAIVSWAPFHAMAWPDAWVDRQAHGGHGQRQGGGILWCGAQLVQPATTDNLRCPRLPPAVRWVLPPARPASLATSLMACTTARRLGLRLRTTSPRCSLRRQRRSRRQRRRRRRQAPSCEAVVAQLLHCSPDVTFLSASLMLHLMAHAFEAEDAGSGGRLERAGTDTCCWRWTLQQLNADRPAYGVIGWKSEEPSNRERGF